LKNIRRPIRTTPYYFYYSAIGLLGIAKFKSFPKHLSPYFFKNSASSVILIASWFNKFPVKGSMGIELLA
jgi:hypothetical protein